MKLQAKMIQTYLTEIRLFCWRYGVHSVLAYFVSRGLFGMWCCFQLGNAPQFSGNNGRLAAKEMVWSRGRTVVGHKLIAILLCAFALLANLMNTCFITESWIINYPDSRKTFNKRRKESDRPLSVSNEEHWEWGTIFLSSPSRVQLLLPGQNLYREPWWIFLKCSRVPPQRRWNRLSRRHDEPFQIQSWRRRGTGPLQELVSSESSSQRSEFQNWKRLLKSVWKEQIQETRPRLSWVGSM